jgi:hypothetical protein
MTSNPIATNSVAAAKHTIPTQMHRNISIIFYPPSELQTQQGMPLAMTCTKAGQHLLLLL